MAALRPVLLNVAEHDIGDVADRPRLEQSAALHLRRLPLQRWAGYKPSRQDQTASSPVRQPKPYA